MAFTWTSRRAPHRGGGRLRRLGGGALALAVFASVVTAAPGLATEQPVLVSVIVRESVPESTTAEQLVTDLGGSVIGPLELIGGFVAAVPSSAIAALNADASVAAATPDGELQLLGRKPKPLDGDAGMDTTAEFVKALGVDRFWQAGYHGTGVDVALIDSGVAEVEGLLGDGKVAHGPDLSFESQSSPDRLHTDSYGHGTHLAGIIVGRDTGAPLPSTASQAERHYYGVAPDADLVSVKVAGSDGIVDVSQVIAAIDWVVQHRNDRGLNIRVLNLSFGTDSTQAYQLDPLSFAVEQAWRHGIVVVVAVGNDGAAAQLRNPATNPFVVAVGAADTEGTTRTSDDEVMEFSNCGTVERHTDIVAPGKSVLGLVNPTSTAGVQHPESVIGDRFIKGSGTSQAAAVVSGLAALIIEQRPDVSPDQVKALLMGQASSLNGVSPLCQGAGVPNMAGVLKARSPRAVTQTWEASTGLGSLHESRGSFIVSSDGVPLVGEQDVMGNEWDAEAWAGLSWSSSAWTAGQWNGATWSGATWSGLSWSGATWSGLSWSGLSWSGLSWSGLSWSGLSWSSNAWS